MNFQHQLYFTNQINQNALFNSFLNVNNFVLIIMTEVQGKTLKKFGTDCICIDGTHGVYDYSNELTILLDLHKLHRGFP